MNTSEDLKRQLSSIDHKSYGAYKTLAGQYDFREYRLSIDHVQGDPFASPSKLRIIVDQRTAGFPESLFDQPHKKTALADDLTRRFARSIASQSTRAGGSGKSGLIFISRCGQEILERTAVQIDKSAVTVRFEVGFPAAGRTILARELGKILFDILPGIVSEALICRHIPRDELEAVARLAEDQFYIRGQLSQRDLCAFVADGSILPRESGVSDRPLTDGIAFVSPESLKVEMELPNRGKLTGMGIKKGVTLIVGGGYHGKSTLLSALELGVYNHIAGDGREYVITDSSAVKIRAEDGRSIRNTDISPFIDNLPNGKDTHRFNTDNASGSTSQAANVVEAMESGSRLLLIDEDTSATNFMIRDEIMQRLITAAQEPITPFTERIRLLFEDFGISTVLVVGSSGTYFSLADTVIQMDAYIPKDITSRAREVCEEYGVSLNPSAQKGREKPLSFQFERSLKKGSVRAGERGVKIKAQGRDALSINRETIDLRYLEQLADPEQIMTMGFIIKYAEEHFAGRGKSLAEIVDIILSVLEKDGLSAIAGNSYYPGSLAMPRKQEILACFNRFRSLKV